MAIFMWVCHVHGPLVDLTCCLMVQSQELAERTAKALLPTIENRLANFEVWNVWEIQQEASDWGRFVPSISGQIGDFLLGLQH